MLEQGQPSASQRMRGESPLAPFRAPSSDGCTLSGRHPELPGFQIAPGSRRRSPQPIPCRPVLRFGTGRGRTREGSPTGVVYRATTPSRGTASCGNVSESKPDVKSPARRGFACSRGHAGAPAFVTPEIEASYSGVASKRALAWAAGRVAARPLLPPLAKFVFNAGSFGDGLASSIPRRDPLASGLGAVPCEP